MLEAINKLGSTLESDKGNYVKVADLTLRLSGSPKQLPKEARSWQVRSKRLFGAA